PWGNAEPRRTRRTFVIPVEAGIHRRCGSTPTRRAAEVALPLRWIPASARMTIGQFSASSAAARETTTVTDRSVTFTTRALALLDGDPRIVWAGTGENNNRQSSSWGGGVYRSTDGGETWSYLGLHDTRSIGRVVLHPTDLNVAYVAAVGNLWRGNPERGVFK